MIERFFEVWSRVVLGHPRWVALATLLLLLVLGVSISRLRFETDLQVMIPTESGAVLEEVDRVFLPVPHGHQAPAPGSEVFIDLEDDDFPDHIDGPEVDLSALLIETLALAIDPYPRREGEDMASLGVDLGEGEGGPFAALARLKDKGEK